MIASVLVSKRRRDCLHQTPMEAQPPRSGGTGRRPVVLRLAAVDGLHVESVAEDKLEALLVAQVGDPVPAEQTFDGDHQVLSVGGESLQQQLALTGQLPVHQSLALLVQDAEIEAAS